MSDLRDPVGKSPLSQEGKSLDPVIVGARLGLRSNVADSERPQQAAKVLHNLQMHKKRYIWTFSGIGFSHLNSVAYNSGAKGLGFGRFVDSSGVLHALAQYGSRLGSVNLSDGTFTNIKTGLSATHRPCMRGYAPSTSTAQTITVYCNGDIEPRKVTATNAEAALLFNGPGVWPGTFASKSYSKPKFCEPFGDRMVYAGFSGTSTQFDILISDQGDAESFTLSAPVVATDAVALASYPELGPITALKAFGRSGQNGDPVLLVGHKRGIAVITGTNASNYRIDILTDHHGIVNNNVFANVFNDLIYLGTAGVFRYSSVALGNTLPQHADSRWVQDIIERIDFDDIGDAHVVHHPLTQEVHFYFPFVGDGGVTKNGLIWNYNTEETDANLLTGIWSTKNGFSISASAEFGNKMFGASYDGFLQKHYDTSEFNGKPIPYRYLSALVGAPNPAQSIRCKQVDIFTDGKSQKFNVNCYVYEERDGNTVRVLAEPSDVTLQAAAAGTNIFPLTFPFSFPVEHVKVISFNPKLHGRFMELEILAGPTADNALEFNSAEITLSVGGFIR